MILDFGISKKENETSYTSINNNESNYKEWKSFKSDQNYVEKSPYNGFFMTQGAIHKHLPYLTTRALNLYILYGLHSKTDSGKTWVSIESCADKLAVDPRSINTWNQSLINKGLIARVKENHSSITTYLLPLSDFAYFENETDPSTYNLFSKQEVNGNLTNIFHLFQWENTPSSPNDYIQPNNIICLVYKRPYTLDGTNPEFITKVVAFKNVEEAQIKINTHYNEFEDNMAFHFQSPYNSIRGVSITGLAITHDTDLNDPEMILGTLKQFIEADSAIEETFQQTEALIIQREED